MPIAQGVGMACNRFRLDLAQLLPRGTGVRGAGKEDADSGRRRLTVGRAGPPIQPVPGERFYLLVFGSHDCTPPAREHAHLGHAGEGNRSTRRRATSPRSPHHQLAPHAHSISTPSLPDRTGNERGPPCHDRKLLADESTDRPLGSIRGVAWFAHRFLTQKQFLDSGIVGYQCVDNLGESARTVSDAIASTQSPTWIRSIRAGVIR